MSILTVEVLLLATAADDRGKRFDRYRRNPDLVECAGYLRGNGTRHLYIYPRNKEMNQSWRSHQIAKHYLRVPIEHFYEDVYEDVDLSLPAVGTTVKE